MLGGLGIMLYEAQLEVVARISKPIELCYDQAAAPAGLLEQSSTSEVLRTYHFGLDRSPVGRSVVNVLVFLNVGHDVGCW